MRAAVYARFSSNLQSDASIEDQVRTCRERIEQEGWSFVEVYKDAAISGATTLRPGYQKLLEDARADRFDIVLAEALDRLSRDQEDVAGLYKKLSFAGIKLITLAEGEINELHIGLKGSMNAILLKDLAAKIRRGQIGRVIAGFSAGGISYGYEVVRELDANGDVIRGKRNINPEQSEIVRQIYKEYVGGKSPRAIAADLNRDGIPSPRDGQWNASTINGHRSRHNGILQNELYIGLMVYNRIRMVRDPETGKRISRINPKDVWVVTEVPELRIIPDELWNQAQAIKARYSNQPAHKNRRPKSLLSGLLACGECGSSFSIVRPGKYGCSAHREKGTCENGRQIARDVLERRVLAGIKERLLNSDFLTEFTREFHRELKRQRARGTTSHDPYATRRSAAAGTSMAAEEAGGGDVFEAGCRECHGQSPEDRRHTAQPRVPGLRSRTGRRYPRPQDPRRRTRVPGPGGAAGHRHGLGQPRGRAQVGERRRRSRPGHRTPGGAEQVRAVRHTEATLHPHTPSGAEQVREVP